MEAVIKPCTPCKNTPASQFQDKEYGRNQRVYNPTKRQESKTTQQYRCTICGTIK